MGYSKVLQESSIHSGIKMDHDAFLSRIAKTFYYARGTTEDNLSLPLTELAAEIYNNGKKDAALNKLSMDEAAQIARNACVSTCSLVLAVVYLERIKASNPDYVEKVAPSELFLISLLTAGKFLNDETTDDYVLNVEWATSAGLTREKINAIEKDFLNAINWNVFVSEDDFWKHLKKMEVILAKRASLKRGWYSYTELLTILNEYHNRHILNMKHLAVISAVCLTSYTALCATLCVTGCLANQIKTALTVSNCVGNIFIPSQPSVKSPQGISLEEEEETAPESFIIPEEVAQVVDNAFFMLTNVTLRGTFDEDVLLDTIGIALASEYGGKRRHLRIPLSISTRK